MGKYFLKEYEEHDTHPDVVLTTEQILSKHGRGISIACFRTIFPHLKCDNRNILAEINKYLEVFDDLELITLAQVMMEYRDYMKVERGKFITYVDYFKATKFVLDIQGGKSKFESYMDTHHYVFNVKRYKEIKDTNNQESKWLKQCIATASAAFSNSTVVLTLAQALDAPIQISYQGYKSQMIEILRDIATDPKASHKTRMEAANSLLTQLNPNNISTLQIQLGKDEKDSFINEARSALKMLAEKKLELFKNNENNKSEIINVDLINEIKKEVENETIKDAELEEEEQLSSIKEVLQLENKEIENNDNKENNG